MYVVGLGEHKSKFLADIYITFIDLAWPLVMFILFTIYLIIFMVFAIFWWLMAFNNGDLDNLDNSDHKFCLVGVESFPTAILFSLETQTTIGYGTAYPNSECAATVPLMYLQVTYYPNCDCVATVSFMYLQATYYSSSDCMAVVLLT